jgi:tartrate dehydratase alpha subunit/fumarate hydratase class I-like protein
MIAVAASLLIAAAFCAKADAKLTEKFRQTFEQQAKEAGKDFGKCEFKELGEGPDGEGGTATAVGVACEKAPYICVFAVRMAKNGEPEMAPIDCRPNPLYDQTPKQSI